MSTIFGHGRLRLYLLKLLDESPKHGYEIISLLRDRFMGVYSPSPGTIYPRLARLEEEGLVTHEEVNGRKVYRLTDKGREELRSRSSDLNDLERELTESVRDVARAVKEDVRDTISSLREELKYAASGGRRSKDSAPGEGAAAEGGTGPEGSGEGAGRERSATEDADRGPWWGRDWERLAKDVGGSWKGAWGSAWGGWGSWGERRSEGGEGREGSEDAGSAASDRDGAGGREFDQALHDFADRVRDMVREAGTVGETAVRDFRRILDDTLDVLQRDMAGWGPGGKERTAEEEEEEGGGTTAREASDTADTAGASGGEGPRSGQEPPKTEEKGPFAQPPAAEDASDPWSTAIREQDRPEQKAPEAEAEAGGRADPTEDGKGDAKPGTS
ncbi:PadR family transcriptional regulator [Nocardiopsis halophila]|uniref:PadR family transcriptional regulator n=1 Tax=Nocardiopsis halophila TaxID=141692 RepID=UPI0003493DA7|nr:PadR family transcriptional regulator [Nocardiopsis halophila]